MLALLIFMSFILVVCGYLLFASFYVEINSLENYYGFRFARLAKARLVWDEKSLMMDLYVAGWNKRIDLLTRGTKRIKRTVSKSPTKRRRNFRKLSFGLLKDLFFSFKINKCHLIVDTGNAALNGLAYPLFYWTGSYVNKPIGISFTGRNELILEIENSLANILKIFIYSKFKNHGKFK